MPTLTVYPNPTENSIVNDSFNSYNDGDLNGQGSWSGNTEFDIQGTIVAEGTKAVKTSNAGAKSIAKSGTGKTAGVQSCKMRTNTNIGDSQCYLSLYEGSTFITAIYMYNGSFYAAIDGADLNLGISVVNDTFHKCSIEWRSSDKKARYKIDNNAWSDWQVTQATYTTNIDTVKLETATGNFDGYWDLLGSDTVDGFAGRITDESWANKISGAGTHSSPSNTTDNIYLAASASGNNWNSLYRLLMLFDTSALPDGAVISAAKLGIYINSITNTLGKIGERYYDAVNGGWAFGTGKFLGQKFTVGNTGDNVAHTVKFLNLKLYKTGNPGTVDVLIQGVSGGLPDGNTLCSGTIDGNGLTTDTNGAWYKINMGAGGDLSPSTQYCYIVKATSGDTSNRVFNMRNPTSASYTGGEGLSYDTPNWSSLSSIDYVFEICYSASVNIVSSTPASDTTIANADYSQLGSTKFSSNVFISSLLTGQYNEISLNATGIAAISKTGVTKLGIRIDCDIDNTEPSWQASAEANIQINMADNGSNVPYLEITYAANDITVTETFYLTDSKLANLDTNKTETINMSDSIRTLKGFIANIIETIGLSDIFKTPNIWDFASKKASSIWTNNTKSSAPTWTNESKNNSSWTFPNKN